MPIYDYRCTDCGKTYDVFHKVREVPDDVVCPDCQSPSHQRLLSAPNVPMSGRSSREYSPAASDCSTEGGCCGGACGVN